MLLHHALFSILLATLFSASHANEVVRDEVVFFHTDALGSAIAAVDESGNQCWTERYTPYGDKTVNEDSASRIGCGIIGAERGYTGHTDDDSTGLVYMQQRYYDPTMGRFLSVDPAGVDADDPRTFNRYSYAANNPYKYIDPDGRIFIFALVPISLKALDIAITAAEVTAAVQSGGATAAAGVVAESVATSLVPIPGANAIRKLAKSVTNVPKGGPTKVRRFMSKSEMKTLKKEGVNFDTKAGNGIPTTTTNFTPKNQDVARGRTGAPNAQYQVDLDVTGLPQGAPKTTKSSLPEYTIKGDLSPDRIINIQKVPK